jgi:hypothetical protein
MNDENDPDILDPNRYISELPKRRWIERWVFTRTERKNPKHCHSYDIFIAHPSGESDEGVVGYEMGIQVERNGHATNSWEDGTRGVPQMAREDAEAEETLISTLEMGNNAIADTWLNVYTDKSGNFYEWAPEEHPMTEGKMNPKLPDVLIDLHDLFTAVKCRPVGPEITFHFVIEGMTFSQARQLVVDFLNKHQLAANEIMIVPGQEDRRKWNRAVTLRIDKTALIPSGKFL